MYICSGEPRWGIPTFFFEHTSRYRTRPTTDYLIRVLPTARFSCYAIPIVYRRTYWSPLIIWMSCLSGWRLIRRCYPSYVITLLFPVIPSRFNKLGFGFLGIVLFVSECVNISQRGFWCVSPEPLDLKGLADFNHIIIVGPSLKRCSRPCQNHFKPMLKWI